MITTGPKRSCAVLSFACVLAFALQGCGGGGGGGGTGGGNTPGAGTPRPTNTPVRAGSPQPGQANTPATPTATGAATTTPAPDAPTETPTATPFIPVQSGGDLNAVVNAAAPGSLIVVAPGNYAQVVLHGRDRGPLTIVADLSGSLTESGAAPVTIDAHGRAAAVDLANQTGVILDGFTVRGATDAGILLTNSPGTIVENCVITKNTGDGVRFDRSDDGFVFDNLIVDNQGAGIRVLHTNNLEVVNNTVYKSKAGGITVSSSDSTFLENNIFNRNTPAGMIVDPSATAFDGDYDLNTDGYQGTSMGTFDVTANPLFLSPLGGTPNDGDFLLLDISPAVDAGNPDTDPDLIDFLDQRTTQLDKSVDTGPVDLGYHYSAPVPTSTRVPRATNTRPRATATPGAPGTATATRPPAATATLGTPRPTSTPLPTATTRGPPKKPTSTPFRPRP